MKTVLRYTNRYIPVLTAGLMISYLFSLHLVPYALSYLAKSLPIFLLAWLSLANIKQGKGRLISLALCFSGIGDILLATRIKGGFIMGMLAFAIAHLFYCSVFLRQVTLTRGRILTVFLLLMYTAGFGIVLQPNLKLMLVPVMIYMVVIMIMAIAAALGRNNHLLIGFGAVMFILSDSLIAWNGFVMAIPYARHWIMITYYAAQILIVYGSILSFKD